MPVSASPRPNRGSLVRPFVRGIASLSLAGFLVACGGGGGGNGGGQGAPTAGQTGDVAQSIAAQNLEFNTDTLLVPAGSEFTLSFTNNEGQPHNVAIYREQGGEEIFVGEVITGPDNTVEYTIPALEVGTYYFQCDVHPDMNGTVQAE